jgi:hypothetical protein
MRNCTELGYPPDGLEISRMLDEGFFLPAASKAAHHQLKEAARQLVLLCNGVRRRPAAGVGNRAAVRTAPAHRDHQRPR